MKNSEPWQLSFAFADNPQGSDEVAEEVDGSISEAASLHIANDKGREERLSSILSGSSRAPLAASPSKPEQRAWREGAGNAGKRGCSCLRGAAGAATPAPGRRRWVRFGNPRNILGGVGMSIPSFPSGFPGNRRAFRAEPTHSNSRRPEYCH